MDSGAETINDENERRELRAQARKVHRDSLLLAVVLTAIVTLVPSLH